MQEIIISPIRYTYENEYGRYKVLRQKGDNYVIQFERSKELIMATKEDILKNIVNPNGKSNLKSSCRKKKSNIDVMIILDTREQITAFLNTMKIDKTYGSDKIKISSIKQECVKPQGCDKSTSDMTIKVRKEGETTYKPTKLAIEFKRGADLLNTLYSNMKRFNAEIDRALNAELDFIILHDWTFEDVKKQIKKLQGMRKMGYKTQPFLTFLNNYLKISKKCNVVCCGDNFEETVRRYIKQHIQENKLQ